MPYLRMFLGEKQIDELFISEVYVQSVLGHHFIEEEKQRMRDKHVMSIRNAQTDPLFVIDAVPSSINYFTPLKPKEQFPSGEE